MSHDNAVQDGASGRDLARQPVSALLWWMLPAAIAIASSNIGIPVRDKAWVWSAAFAWMAIGCLLNEYRCRRLHCYMSGPVLLIGAGATALIGSGMLDTHAFSSVIDVTIILVCLSFVPEWLWGKYRTAR